MAENLVEHSGLEVVRNFPDAVKHQALFDVEVRPAPLSLDIDNVFDPLAVRHAIGVAAICVEYPPSSEDCPRRPSTSESTGQPDSSLFYFGRSIQHNHLDIAMLALYGYGQSIHGAEQDGRVIFAIPWMGRDEYINFCAMIGSYVPAEECV
jgi:hypothetical protein